MERRAGVPQPRDRGKLRRGPGPGARYTAPKQAIPAVASRQDGVARRLPIKYEELYLNAYETVSAAREGIGRYINFYNTRRPHSSYKARTPDVVYFASLHQPSADAA